MLINTNFLPIFGLGLAIFVLSSVVVRFYSRFAPHHGFIDIPNSRSSHQIPTPTGAGITFVLIWLAAVTALIACNLITVNEWLLFAPMAALLSLIGFFDDRHQLSARIRLYTQFIAALFCLAIMGGISSLHLWGAEPTVFTLGGAQVQSGAIPSIFHNFSATFTLLGIIFGSILGMLWIMWSINLFNFMDGLDGLAAIEAIFVFGLGGLFFWLEGHYNMALIPWIMVFAVGGFLLWNWPKAKVFMGDVGSYCLGFLVAMLSLVADAWYNIPITLWVMIYSVFWFDASITLLRRLYYKKNLAMAHRDHAHQRLHRAGFSHKQVVYAVIVLNSILSVITLWSYYHPSWMMASLALIIGLLTIAYLFVERLLPMEGFIPKNELHSNKSL